MAAAPEETAGEAERDAGAAPVSQDGGRQHLSCALCISGSPPAPPRSFPNGNGFISGGGLFRRWRRRRINMHRPICQYAISAGN